MDLNKEETEFLKSIENERWESVTDIEKRKKELKIAAENTMRKDKRINIRISERDFFELKKRAFEEGLPYQTFVSSILHKFVNGRYIESQK